MYNYCFDDRLRNFSEEFNILRDMISQRPKFREKVAASLTRDLFDCGEKETW